MGATKTFPSNKLADVLSKCVTQYLAPDDTISVGLSGGLDSVVLLHLMAELRQELRLQISAVHIHHGISNNADNWAESCKIICHRLDIPLQIHKLTLDPGSKSGLEATARAARYSIFRQLDTNYIALAHHRDDQAETVLLQLLRGAGVKGLSAMPVLRRNEGGPAYLRPLLNIDRSAILDWAVQNNISWVEDESNQDTKYSRNYLRHNVLPLLQRHYPSWRSTIARSAGHMAEAAGLLDELAELDAQNGINRNRLDCTYLAGINPARARNLLRYFFARRQLPMPSQLRLAEMLDQLLQAADDAGIAIDHANTCLRRYAGYAYLTGRLDALPGNSRWSWQGEGELTLPELNGTLYFRQSLLGGLDPAKLQHINIRLRQGGERLKPDCKRPVRRVKDLLQAAHLPPWERDRLPLIYSGDELIHIPGIGTACQWQTGPAQAGIDITWRPKPANTDQNDD
ncbi:MAG: tRNA lysidine(34) synthetase TilS [Burkholderiales bacterium]